MALSISVRVNVRGEWRAIAEVSLKCEVCGTTYSNLNEQPITGAYDFLTHRIVWDEEVLKDLRENSKPEGWTSQGKSKIFSGEGHLTSWTEWYCPECSSK